jgi:dTDP-glucose 4,6-dehydratase
MKITGKKILVTGSEGCKIKAMILYNSMNSYGWLDQIEKKNLSKIEFFFGDIRDIGSVQNAVKDCDFIFHLAALISIPYSYLAPISYLRTNVEGTLNILEAARKNKVQRVIITSTSENYGSAQYTPIDEHHILQPQSPYSASKISADMFADSYFRSFNLPIIIARPFNVFGPRQSLRAVIPSIIMQLTRGPKLYVGNIDTIRDYTYVKDTVDGLVSLLKHKSTVGKIFNIGSNKKTSIKNIIKLASSILGVKPNIIVQKNRFRPSASEVLELHCDSKKIRKFTNWDNKFTFLDGLKETIDWFKQNKDNKNFNTDIYNL